MDDVMSLLIRSVVDGGLISAVGVGGSALGKAGRPGDEGWLDADTGLR